MASCTAKAGASSANRTLCLTPLLRAECSCVFELFLEQLLLIQVRVIAAAFEQLVVRAAFPDRGFIALCEVNDVAVEAGDFRGHAAAFRIVILHSKGDVSADGFAEQVGVLRDIA